MTRNGVTQTRSFTYDSATQRLFQVITPESGATNYTYYDYGALKSITDAMGQKTQYEYDLLGRVSQVDSFLSGSSQADLCQRVGFTYDWPTVSQGANPIGRLTQMSWSGGPGCIYQFSENYAYDAQGQVWRRVFTMSNPAGGYQDITLESDFQYDAEGRLTVATYPAGTERQKLQKQFHSALMSGPGVARAVQRAHQERKVAGRCLNQELLVHIVAPSHVEPVQAPGVELMREVPLDREHLLCRSKYSGLGLLANLEKRRFRHRLLA